MTKIKKKPLYHEDILKGMITRPMTFSELYLILYRFEIALDENPDIDIEEFIKQEDHRRNLFPTSPG